MGTLLRVGTKKTKARDYILAVNLKYSRNTSFPFEIIVKTGKVIIDHRYIKGSPVPFTWSAGAGLYIMSLSEFIIK